MPYKLDCNEDGCYVINKETGKRKNKKRMPKSKAKKYMKALYHAESGAEFTGKEETMKEFIEDFLMVNKVEKKAKELSLDEKLNHIRDEIRNKFNPPMRQDAVIQSEPYYWVQWIYDDYAIINKDEEYFRVDYSVDSEGNVSLGEIQAVEMDWVMKGLEEIEPLATFKQVDTEELAFEIKADEGTMERFKRLLAIMHRSSDVGHTGLFAMSVDGDGHEIFKVKSGVDYSEYKEGMDDVAGYSVEIAKSNGYGHMTAKEEPDTPHLMVFKEKKSGDYRWIMFSSNAFQDRDGEIVSLKALTDDVARADEDGLYGPLRWWHIGDPDPATKSAGPGLDIGDCDFNTMHGKILIESGTFRDQEIGEIIAEKASELQGSILFFHPQSEPDDEGVFHNIHRAERSLLPKGKASNSLVSLLVAKKESDMSKISEKFQIFIAKLGGDEKKVQEALEQAELTEKDAEALGITWKGEDPDPDGDPEGGDPEGGDPEGDDPEGDVEKILGDMTPKDFQELQAESLKGVIEPLSVQLKEIQTAQAKVDDTQISLKEAVDNQSKLQKEMDERLKELEGETPRGQKGYRPSQDDDTVIDDDHSLKGVKPGIDPEFMSFVLPGEGSG